jgi:tryptophanyl-tRNA synthetase
MTAEKFKDIIVSGTRPTGNLHLGNYIGAVQQYVKMQDLFEECYFFIADVHSLTTHPNPKDLEDDVQTVLVEYLASGLDPEKITIYRQSDLRATFELYLFLNMHAYKGELERVTTFKEKARKHPDNINAGLLTYPVLMASDILIHKGTKVPVGKDQEQHLEMARTFAKRFNHIYKKDILPEPQAYNTVGELIKVPGLQGPGKMSKSDNEKSVIYLKDSPEEIHVKFRAAVTDGGPTQMNQEKPEIIENLFTLMKHVSKPETLAFYNEQYNTMRMRYGDMKNQLADDMIIYLAPIREKIEAIKADKDYLKKVLKDGTEKATANAEKTLGEARRAVGFRH